jgi:hypothetical protein
VRLKDERRVVDTNFTYLLCHQKARIFMGEQYGWTAASTAAAMQSLLQQTAVTVQAKEWFRIAFA